MLPDVNSKDISLTDNIGNVSLKNGQQHLHFQITSVIGFTTVANSISHLQIRLLQGFTPWPIGNCRNVRGLGKSMVVFRLFEKLRYSNERSTKFENIYQE